MTERLFLCTDMDRTLLPNGMQPESPRARDCFAKFVNEQNVCLAYVTGRHLALVEEAIAEYGVPVPDFAITDVGTCIYERVGSKWQVLEAWESEIRSDWRGKCHADLKRAFADIDGLVLQPEDKQNHYKLSYFYANETDICALLSEMQRRLSRDDVKASLVSSYDEELDCGLLDVLPLTATKAHAIDFLRQWLGYALDEVVFAGDSGNDLAVMASHLPSVLVANASEDVRREALRLCRASANSDSLYLARGDFYGMNGNYAAGILEGVCHFIPEMEVQLAGIVAEVNARG